MPPWSAPRSCSPGSTPCWPEREQANLNHNGSQDEAGQGGGQQSRPAQRFGSPPGLDGSEALIRQLVQVRLGRANTDPHAGTQRARMLAHGRT